MQTSFTYLSTLLMKGYKLNTSDYCIKKNGISITNFIPVVCSAKEVHDSNGISKHYIICFYFETKQTEMVQISDSKFDKQAFYPTCACITGSKKAITDFIRQQILRMKITPVYHVENGWNHIGTDNFYVLKNKICGPCNVLTDITPESNSAEYPSDDAHTNASHLWKFVQLSGNVPSILLLGTAAGLLSTLLNSVGFSPLVIFLYGKSSTFKTSVAALLTSVHGSKANMISLASSPTSIRDFVIAHKDIPIVIDDMNKSDRKSIMTRNEEIISNHCQTIVDSGKLILRQGKSTFEAVIQNASIITAEYPLKNISTRNRIVELPMEEISSDELRKCQELEITKNIMETFALHFTSFVSKNMEKILGLLQTEIIDTRNDILDPRSKSSYRINANMRLLFAVAHVLERYLKQEAELPQKYLEAWANLFQKSIKNICSDQLHEIADLECDFENTRYIIALYRELFYVRMDDLPEGERQYLKEKKRYLSLKAKPYDQDPIGFRSEYENNILCIPGDDLLGLVCSKYPDASKKAISKQLNAFSLLKMDSSHKNSIKVGCHTKRYYHIYIDDLMRIGEELYNKNKTGGEINV